MNKEIFHKHLLFVAFRHSGREFTKEDANYFKFKYLMGRSIDILNSFISLFSDLKDLIK